MGQVSAVFIDTNVLVYASIPVSPFYADAQNWLRTNNQTGIQMYISRQILREYLAVLSRAQAITPAIPISTLITEVQAFESQFTVLEDGPDVTKRLLALLAQIPAAGRQIHDANIVATMQAYGITRLLTNNVSDFTRFLGLIDVVSLV
jgi:predicted nucleic acid-binding protein